MTMTPIRVVVNGQPESYPAETTLGAVVSRLRPSRTGIAVAVGDAVVPRTEWDSRHLRDGDEIEILTAVQGG
ncbi:MAG TPA: sulfur carrier protein ThiS [Actinocrinis sp.]|nr:sulfur carrier protein ThiS [Actinocrinis sp.]